jgi:hypothetical protein
VDSWSYRPPAPVGQAQAAIVSLACEDGSIAPWYDAAAARRRACRARYPRHSPDGGDHGRQVRQQTPVARLPRRRQRGARQVQRVAGQQQHSGPGPPGRRQLLPPPATNSAGTSCRSDQGWPCLAKTKGRQ